MTGRPRSRQSKRTQGTVPVQAAVTSLRSKAGSDTISDTLVLVTIGASAGGLEAFEQFFKGLPAAPGAAFVVIQHLSADHKSMMSSLLSRHTDMPMVVVEDGMTLRSNNVFLIPAGFLMHLEGITLRLVPKNPRELSLPIDVFFQSMAEQHSGKSVGIILSGTGSDGTRGAKALHEAGGFLMVQEPETAKFDGMPRNAIATGLIDVVAPVTSLAPQLMQFISGTPSAAFDYSSESAAVSVRSVDDPLPMIIGLLLHATGINFADYKPGTILRRIERRMAIRQTQNLESYLTLLAEDRGELQLLGRELLIPVTHFFRDTEAFQSLRTKVIEPLVSGRSSTDTIRVWCAGVSTGEEVYSIAMMFLETFETMKRWPVLKIFASDVDQRAIEHGAAGLYSEAIAADITADQLERFFTRRGDQLQVKNELRQCIVFAKHNLLNDPPFTKMDLVVCRNTLIYFRPEAQERSLRRLQYAMAPNGYLFLGSSEALGALHTDFQPINARHKIWQVIRASKGLVLQPAGGVLAANLVAGLSRRILSNETIATAPSAVEVAKLTLQGAFAPPPALLISSNQEVVHFFGDAHRYLSFPQGQASFELRRILPEPVKAVAAALLFRVARENTQVTAEPLRLPSETVAGDGSAIERLVRLSAIPVPVQSEGNHILLIFEDVGIASKNTAQVRIDVGEETAERMGALENELASVRETLQATIEALETSNEELQAINEELMASNEELQSSNEELQSVNEELNTVNAEYQEKMEILNKLNADLESLTKIVTSGTIFVDHDLRLTRFSTEAASIFKIQAADIGRLVGEFQHSLVYPNMVDDLQNTLDTGKLSERHITGQDDRRFLVKMLPYRIPSTALGGVVVTFVDTTVLHLANRLQAVIDALSEHIAVLRYDGTIELVNEAWKEFARENGDPELLGSGPGVNYLNICRIAPESPDSEYAEQVASGLRAVLMGQRQDFSMEYPCHSPTKQRWFLMHVRALLDSNGGAVVSHVNITRWRQVGAANPAMFTRNV